MESEIQNSIIAIETKITYLEDFVAKLQEATLENQKTIDILQKENRILVSRISELMNNAEIPNRKPPHY